MGSHWGHPWRDVGVIGRPNGNFRDVSEVSYATPMRLRGGRAALRRVLHIAAPEPKAHRVSA
jgi:hypothetical protein